MTEVNVFLFVGTFLLGALAGFIATSVYRDRREYHSKTGDLGVSDEGTVTCDECGHVLSSFHARYAPDLGWFCPEHRPKYDGYYEDWNEKEHIFVKIFHRNRVPCDENGVILKQAIKPKK